MVMKEGEEDERGQGGGQKHMAETIAVLQSLESSGPLQEKLAASCSWMFNPLAAVPCAK